MKHFIVATPDGVKHEHVTNQPITHAVIKDYGQAWYVLVWTTSQALADKHIRRHTYAGEGATVRVVAVQAVQL